MTELRVKTVFGAKTVVASATETSGITDISGASGFFSLQATITGDGTVKLGYIASNDKNDFIAPEGEYSGSNFVEIMSGLTKTSGPGSDGKVLVQFSPHFARYYKIVAIETGGANSVTITVNLATL